MGMKKEIDEISIEVDRILAGRPSAYRNPKYNRHKHFEFKVPILNKNRTMSMIYWCNANCQEGYSSDPNDTMSFKNKDDAILFKLTWGGDV